MKFKDKAEAKAKEFFKKRGFSLKEIREGSKGEKLDDETRRADRMTEAIIDFESEYPVSVGWVLSSKILSSRKKSYRARKNKANRKRK